MDSAMNQAMKKNTTERALISKESAITDALLKLENAHCLLSEWVQDYSYLESPDPRAALQYLCNPQMNEENKHQRQSLEWFYYYDKIFRFVDMSHTFIHEAKTILEESIHNKL